MFGLRSIFSFLLLVTVAWSAAIPHDSASNSPFEKRQGSCMSALARPNPVNNVGRISFQREVIDQQDYMTRWPNNFIDVHLNGESVQQTNDIHVTITNNESQGNAIIFTNFRDTLPGTQPREQVRVEVPGSRRVNGAVIAGKVDNQCVHLPRLDGTWYFQIER